MQLAGGCRVHAFFGGEIAPENADYYFEGDAVVAELKEVRHDPNEDDGLRARISDMYHRYACRGDVPLVFGMAPIGSTFFLRTAVAR